MRNEQLEKYFEKKLCYISLKKLRDIIEEFYIKGDELSIRMVIKNNIECISKDNFRYLLLFISDYEKKMKIYYYAVKNGRVDLLSDIKGLRSKDLENILALIKQEDKRALIIKDLNRALRKENEASKEQKRSKSLKSNYKKISSIVYKNL